MIIENWQHIREEQRQPYLSATMVCGTGRARKRPRGGPEDPGTPMPKSDSWLRRRGPRGWRGAGQCQTAPTDLFFFRKKYKAGHENCCQRDFAWINTSELLVPPHDNFARAKSITTKAQDMIWYVVNTRLRLLYTRVCWNSAYLNKTKWLQGSGR